MGQDASERLQVLYDLSRRLASFDDLDALLRDATRAVREVFRAEGTAILLLDESGKELRFPVSSQAESAAGATDVLRELHFPADEGIAGWVLKHGQSVAVDDVNKDPRFYPGVAKATGVPTRALLAAPLRSRRETIGVVEVINPAGNRFEPEDAAFLEAVASDIGLAYEKAFLYAQLRHEVTSLRGLTRIGGYGLIAVGVLLVAAAAFVNLAHAMPWSRLLTRSGLWAGLLALLTGGAMVRRGFGR
ncbi:MAG TPA: GAF domain-containing protein [Candidatus Limnocylindria bacterium]|nr:GAF domain-containing protein [Candidatus Limnocylindria bacterium]